MAIVEAFFVTIHLEIEAIESMVLIACDKTHWQIMIFQIEYGFLDVISN